MEARYGDRTKVSVTPSGQHFAQRPFNKVIKTLQCTLSSFHRLSVSSFSTGSRNVFTLSCLISAILHQINFGNEVQFLLIRTESCTRSNLHHTSICLGVAFQQFESFSEVSVEYTVFPLFLLQERLVHTFFHVDECFISFFTFNVNQCWLIFSLILH